MDTDPAIPRIVITTGEPAGIGPDILIQTIQQPLNADVVVIADPSMLKQRADLLDLPLNISEFDHDETLSPHIPGHIKLMQVTMRTACIPGIPDKNNVDYVLQTLELACQGCLSKEFSAMVTGPVNKAIINQAGYSFTGHTEFLAGMCGSGYPVMLLANEKLRVALVTTHIPLAEVSSFITRERVEQVIRTTSHDLNRRFAINQPRLLVCGLNPHAGEDGHLGTEELDIVLPVVEKLRKEGMNVYGPVPADTAFTRSTLAGVDAVICMFHDQGLPVIKSMGFGETVNITLGLPVIRTSVDHGTALTLAGTGKADHSSMLAAINSAIGLSLKSKLNLHAESNLHDHSKSPC